MYVMDVVDYIFTIIGIIIVIILVFFIGRYSVKSETYESIHYDTLTIYNTDTIYKDSIHIQETIKEVLTLDTVYIHDTVLITEQKHYKDSLSDIWISGISPNLDSVHYYIPYKETIIEVEKVRQTERKWGCSLIIGPYIGYGIGVNSNKVIISPELGIGISIGFGYYIQMNKQ